MDLYYGETSCASHKAMLYISEMGVSHYKKHIDLRKQEHLSSDYRKINPDGLVPTLVAGGEVICGSTDIMRYIHGHSALKERQLPEALCHRVTEFCYRLEDLHDPYLRTLSYHLLFMNKHITQDKKDQLLELAANHPNKSRGEFLKSAVEQSLDPGLIRQSYEMVEKFVIMLDLLLKDNHFDVGKTIYLMGDQYTMADAAALATLYRIKKLNLPISLNQVSHYFDLHSQRSSFIAAGIK